MYDNDFVIRDFVKENAEEWDLIKLLNETLTTINKKLLYERYYNDKDVGHLSEYLAVVLIKYWSGDAEAASRTAEGIKRYIESERGVK